VSLKKKVVKGVAWVFGLQVAVQGLSFITAIVLARLLLQEDYGIVSLAMVFLSIGETLGDFGLANTLIQRQDKDDRAIYTGAVLRLMFASVMYAFLFFAAGSLAQFFNAPAFENAIRVAGLQLFLSSAGFVALVKLSKELEFNKIAYAGIASGLVRSAGTILLAFLAFKYWSVIFGNLAGSVVNVSLLFAFSRSSISFVFDRKIARELIGFSKYLIGVSVIVLIVFSTDRFLVEKFWGIEVLGAYQVALTWGTGMLSLISNAVSRVAFPAYSKISQERERLKRGYLQTLRMLSAIVFPIGFGMMFLAPWFVRYVLAGGTAKWDAAILPLIVLAGYGIVSSITSQAAAVYISCGNPRINFIQTLVSAIVILALMFPLTYFLGAFGTALAFFLPLPLAIWILYLVTKLVPVTLGEIGRSMLLPLIATICAVPFAYLPLLFLAPSLFTFICQAGAMLIAYISFAHLISKGKLTKEFLGQLKLLGRA